MGDVSSLLVPPGDWPQVTRLAKSTFTYNDTILALVPYFKVFPDKNQYF